MFLFYYREIAVFTCTCGVHVRARGLCVQVRHSLLPGGVDLEPSVSKDGFELRDLEWRGPLRVPALRCGFSVRFSFFIQGRRCGVCGRGPPGPGRRSCGSGGPLTSLNAPPCKTSLADNPHSLPFQRRKEISLLTKHTCVTVKARFHVCVRVRGSPQSEQ